MKTLLRHTATCLYFQGPEKWTNDPAKAYDFRFTDRVLEYVEAWNIRNVELAFAFEDPQSVKVLALDQLAGHSLAA